MKNGVFWDVTPCGSCKNPRFGGIFLRSVRRFPVTASVVRSSPILVTLMKEALSSSETSVHLLLVTTSVVPSSPILVTLMKEALSSSETSVLNRATRRNIPEDTIPQTVHCFILKYLNVNITLQYCWSHWSEVIFFVNFAFNNFRLKFRRALQKSCNKSAKSPPIFHALIRYNGGAIQAAQGVINFISIYQLQAAGLRA
jgi:hypothetical protein